MSDWRRPKVSYEWCWEVTDEYGDIVDCGYYETFTECQADAPSGADIALVQRWGNDTIGDEGDRGYAYAETGANGIGLTLPKYLDNGAKVPQRFHKEVTA